ncbi:hypothetical protein Vafri_15653, partial [Volvox africanus]
HGRENLQLRRSRSQSRSFSSGEGQQLREPSELTQAASGYGGGCGGGPGGGPRSGLGSHHHTGHHNAGYAGGGRDEFGCRGTQPRSSVAPSGPKRKRSSEQLRRHVQLARQERPAPGE